MIFSPEYFKLYNGFYENTFMYMEEDILYYIVKRDKLKILYNPNIVIYHKEFLSTDCLDIKAFKSRRFRYKNVIKFCIEFLKLIHKDKVKIKNNSICNYYKQIEYTAETH